MTTFRFDFPQLHRYPHWSFDTETTGLAYPQDRAFGLSLAASPAPGQYVSWYVDLRLENVADWWYDEVERSSTVVGFNTQFDVCMLASAGLETPLGRQFDCAMVQACLINEHLSTQFPWPSKMRRYSLDDLCDLKLGEKKDESVYAKLAEIFGGPPTRKAQILNLQHAPASVVAPYAERDAVLALRLWEHQMEEIDQQCIQSIHEFERRTVMPCIIRAAMRGVPVDVARAEKAITELTDEIRAMQARLDGLVGGKLNVNSTVQIRKLFNPTKLDDNTWVADNGVVLQSTDSGAPSIGHEALVSMEGDERAELIDGIRSLTKTRDVFLGKYVCQHSYNGRVYPTINQTAGEDGGTRSGRLSYVDPALQQIPSRNKRAAAIVKSCFVAPEGMKWVDSDLSSFEVRVFAHLVAAYNDAVARAYASNPDMDFHQFVADLTGLPRNPQPSGGGNAKQLNLSMIFNSGNGAIAHKMGMDWEWSSFEDNDTRKTVPYRRAGPQAMAVIDQYHNKVQGVKVLAQRMSYRAKTKGYVETMYGRRLRFPKGYKAYKASGLLIQATAADINKENWHLIEDALGSDGHLILNTHDSYSMAIDEDKVQPAYDRVKQAIQRPLLRVPLILELSGVGNTWWEAVKGG